MRKWHNQCCRWQIQFRYPTNNVDTPPTILLPHLQRDIVDKHVKKNACSFINHVATIFYIYDIISPFKTNNYA